ncbi:MAG TPA: hypothetical protein VF783_05695 [Terriglobales bacterium]
MAHLEDSADVAGFMAVEEEVSFGSVGLVIVGTVEELEGDESVEEVT